ncbi:MAG: universal stress protein [Thermosynechococcaceae cyanobacterium]
MFNKILVAIDEATLNQNVFNAALALAKTRPDIKLVFLHILPLDLVKSPAHVSVPGPFQQPNLDQYRSLQEDLLFSQQRQWNAYDSDCLSQLRSYTAEAIKAGIAAEFMQQPGGPGPVICDLATTLSADLILIGNRGRSGLKEVLLGSVSKYVSDHAPCSVMVIRTQSQDDVSDDA